MRPSQKLISFIGHYDLTNEPLGELILLKAEDKKHIDYEDTAEICGMRERLECYNALMKQTQVKLVIPAGVRLSEKSFEDLRRKYPKAFSYLDRSNLKQASSNRIHSNYCLLSYSDITDPVVFPLSICPYLSLIDFSIPPAPFHYSGGISPVYTDEVHYPLEHVQTYRVFNRGHFIAGGRFYNKGLRSYMGLSKELRRYLTLNGHRVVELDYSGLHLRFAYHLKGRDYKGDPYGFCKGNGTLRKALKLAVLILINSHSKEQAARAIRFAFVKNGIPFLADKEINVLIDQLEQEHASIRDFFCSDKGVYFQNLDARIMERILIHFTEKAIPIFPVHDSCVIARHHEQELREVMIEKYEIELGFKPTVH